MKQTTFVALLILGLVAAFAVSCKAASLAQVDQTCSATAGRIDASLNWKAAGAKGRAQWIDLSSRDASFAPGTFVSVGPLDSAAQTYKWLALNPGATHYWRVNTAHDDGWHSSPVGTFVTGTCGAAPAPPPPATSGEPISVRDYTTYRDILGWLHIAGVVENRGQQNREFVSVVASLYSPSGAFVGTGSSYSLLDVIPPGGVSPFEIIVTETVGDVSRVDLVVQSDENRFYTFNRLSVSNVSISRNEFGDTMIGQVTNTTGKPARFVQVVATLFDGGGRVVGTNFAYADIDPLPPGATSPFRMSFLSDQEFASYDLQAEASSLD